MTVSLAVPPLADHVGLLRAFVGMYAARLDLTLEEIDDLRMAVEEAAVQLLRRAAGGPLVVEMGVGPDTLLEIVITGDVRDHDEPLIEERSFSHTILQALADEVVARVEDGRGVVRLRKRPHHATR